ncbi:hypothetical protein MMC19_001419 [Ptychographa xylographoides]|nr:hypothetical protein [Ptychographa xylographoides]
MPYSTSLPSTILFLSLFILAFFPSLFVFLLKLPLNALTLHSFNSNVPVTTRLNKCFSSEAVLDPPPGPPMAFFQKTFTLPSHSRGSYLITNDVVKALPELKSFKVGILHLFVQHTSCALSLNENWDEDVRADMSDALDRIVPEDKGGRGSKGLYRHDAEGSDDMPVCS